MVNKKKQIPKELRALAKTVRKIREEYGISQEELAEFAEIDRTYVSGIERGVRNPSYLVLIKISHGLGLTFSEFVDRLSKR